MIKLEGRIIRLLKDSPPNANTDGRSTEVYRGNGYTVIVKFRQLNQMDEVGYYAGEMVITFGKRRVVVKVVGEIGC